MRHLVFAFLLVGLPRLTVGDDLGDQIREVIEAPQFKNAHWGLLVTDTKTGDTLYEASADKLFAPASTTKLFSVAAALDSLGPEYCFETPIYARGELRDGVLNGDLILVASGDLTLDGRTDREGHIAFRNTDHTYASFSSTAELTEQDPLAGIKQLARQVAASGVRQVRGDVLIDTRLFESASSTGSGPSRVTPIIVNDNVIDFTITPGAEHKKANVDWRPKVGDFTVHSEVETADAGEHPHIDIRREATGYIVRGQIPADHKPLVMVDEVSDPALFTRALLIEAFANANVHIEGPPGRREIHSPLPKAEEYAHMERVAVLKSPRFAESARLILKVSHNLHASTLPLLVAAKNGERTLREGLQRQRDFLERAGVPVDTISFGGGAGGDRADYVTPRATVALLRHMSTRHDFPVYRDALPILGVDGTLAKAVKADSPAKGKVQAKTGTLMWTNTMNGSFMLTSKALAGYAKADSGRELSFAIFVNLVLLKEPTDRDKVGQSLGQLCEIICSKL